MTERKSASSLTGNSLGQVLELVFPKTVVLAEFEPRVEDINVLDSNIAAGIHNLLMSTPNCPFPARTARECLIQIRRATAEEPRVVQLESLARPLLGSLVPGRAHSGSLALPELGACDFVVYALESDDGTIRSLSQVWKDMSSSQRSKVVDQLLVCRKKLGKIKFHLAEEGWDPEESPIPRLDHPISEARELGGYSWLAPQRAHTEGRWKLSEDLRRGGDSRWNHSLTYMSSTLALLEPHMKDEGYVLGEGDDIWISPRAQGTKPVRFSWLQLRRLDTLDRNTLHHCGLFPVNILVTEFRRPFSLAPDYKVTSILGWHQAGFVPIGYDMAVQDAKLGHPGTGDIDGTFYDKIRFEAVETSLRDMSLCETYLRLTVNMPAAGEALRRLLAAVQVFSANKARCNPLLAHGEWMKRHRYTWSGVDKGYTRSVMRPS